MAGTEDTDTPPRAIRVFISSTFRDMQAERDELVKRVFPLVRQRCESRGVVWGEVDLRWGVTDEQKAEGEVLPICLAEILRTRPYFIGLLGQRYGWVPDDLPAALVGEYAWLQDDQGRSVTELEILHGVLNDPGAAGHAYFYLRDPAWVEQLPASQRPLFVEDSASGIARLEALRTRVRGSGFPVRDYPDPVALGQQVLDDLLQLVDRLYPESATPDPWERESDGHRAFAASRFTAYVDRPQLTARLDTWADDTAAPPPGAADVMPLLVTGSSGSGASALAATWAEHYRRTHPDTLVIEHYVGATASSADWTAVVARVVDGLARAAGASSDEVVPSDPTALRARFALALRQAAAARRRVLLVVDGVDRLEDRDGAPDLLWIPRSLPAGVAILLTASGPRPLDTALHRGWPVLEVPALDEAERRSLIARFLSRYAKALDEEHVARLATAPATGNPLFLRTVLDELRQHGDHFTLGERIETMLAAGTVDDLLEQVLTRYEHDFERDRPGLVRDAFTALWAARRGLSEPELLQLLAGDDGLPVPQAVWAPLHLAAEQTLVERSGLMAIGTQHMRAAVRDRYLPDEAARRAAHARLAAYFATRPLGERVVDELAWQQVDAGDIAALAATLADTGFLELAYARSVPEVRRLWARAEEGGHRVVVAYRPVIDHPGAFADTRATRSQTVWAVARLLTDFGYADEALTLNRHLVDDARVDPAGSDEGEGGDARLRAALVNLGAAQWQQGRLDDADATLREAVARCRAAADTSMLQVAVGDLALVRRDRGDTDSAAELFAEEERLCRGSGDAFALQACLGNQAQLLRTVGRPDEALALLREQEQLCRDLADRAGIARALAGQAAVSADRGDTRAAVTLTSAQVAAAREAGDLRGVAEARINESSMLAQLGETGDAAAAAAEAEEVARRLDDGGLLARALAVHAQVAITAGDWARAESYARNSADTARRAEAWPQLALSLGVAGTARREQGDLDGCRALHEEELRVATRTADPQAVASAHANLGTCALAAGRVDDALAEYGVAEPVFRDLGSASSLLPLLANRGQAHEVAGRDGPAATDYADAAAAAMTLGLHQQARTWGERGIACAYRGARRDVAQVLWRILAEAYAALGDDHARQRALGEHALLLINDSQLAQATSEGGAILARADALLDEQERLCRGIRDDAGLTACLGNRAIVRRYQGDLSGSLTLLDQQGELARSRGDGQGWLIATANRGEVLGLLGRTAEALAALRTARDTAAGAGPALVGMVQQLDQMIASLERGG